jgi:hypothetical protein
MKNNEKLNNQDLIHEEEQSLAYIEKAINRIDNVFKQYFPFVYNLLTSSPAKYRKSKAIFCYVIGTVYGLILYGLMISQIQAFSHEFRLLLGVTLILVLSLGMAFNVQMRCIASMSIVNFSSASGRIILTGVLLGLLLHSDGPVSVGIRNGREITDSIICFNSIIYNITSDNIKLKWKPYKDIVVGMIKGHKNLMKSRKEVLDTFSALENEFKAANIREILDLELNETEMIQYDIKDDIDSNGFEKFYKDVNSLRCVDIMRSGIIIVFVCFFDLET